MAFVIRHPIIEEWFNHVYRASQTALLDMDEDTKVLTSQIITRWNKILEKTPELKENPYIMAFDKMLFVLGQSQN